MGIVLRARDTKLDRDVALKVLPEAFTSDPDRVARFEREAKVLASLNHPHIAAIHGFEEDATQGTRALVLELVEGPTLADLIAEGPMAIDDVVPIAKQIAEALEAAHEQGIIHRDLKPANVKVKADGTVKVLDFGLAKAFQPEASGASPSTSPTISLTVAATQMGMVIGTAAYMAPEQASGKDVDKRADVWAFGVVLYEMLTGARPFVGDDVSKTLAHVIAIEPDWGALPKNLPPVLGTFLRGCLEKNPTDRVRDIGDVRLALTGAFDSPSATQPIAPARRADGLSAPRLAVVGALVAVAAGAAGWLLKPAPEPPVPMTTRFAIVPPETAPLILGRGQDLAVSPAGTHIVYHGNVPGESEPHLYVRPTSELGSVPLRGSRGGNRPFFSPTGAWVGFVELRSNTMKRVAIGGGAAVTICEPTNDVLGASWGPDDTIVFGSRNGGLFRVAGTGGDPEALTTTDPEAGETAHRFPSFLPNGNAVLFAIATGVGRGDKEIAVLTLETREVKRLGLSGSTPKYAPTGHLVYAAEGTLRAVPFDLATLDVTGGPVPVVEGIATSVFGSAAFGITTGGLLVYGAGAGTRITTPVWVDRDGREEVIVTAARSYEDPQISPDATRLALTIADEGNIDVWIWDLVRKTLSRLTRNEANDRYPVWSPDGDRIVYWSARDGGGVWSRAADGSGGSERVTGTLDDLSPFTWSPDGQLVFDRLGQSGRRAWDIGMLDMDGSASIDMLLEDDFSEERPSLSQDGRWIAYDSNESGRKEVYVRPFPNIDDDKWLVSNDGGSEPRWSQQGNELFFLGPEVLMAVAVETDPTFSAGTPEALFGTNDYLRLGGARRYDVAPDGDRFVFLKQAEDDEGSTPQINVVLNWLGELEARVPLP